MEEILKDLIKTTLENGPQNKQFYSNLSITKPIHDQAEIQLGLGDAIGFLKSRFLPGKGFQSKIYTSRNCAIESVRACSAFKLPDNTVEVLTSVLALDLLFNTFDNEQFMTPPFQEICNFSDEIQDSLHTLIVPSCGISTFNLFKRLEYTPPVSQSSSPLLQIHDHNNEQFIDSGNDSPSPTPMDNSLTNQEEVQSDTATNLQIFNNFPDDINTSMLTLNVLIHQGILQSKPVESVLKWIISNVFSLENENGQSSSSLSSEAVVVFPTFITRQGNSDPVGVANVLNLMYLLDISHEVLLNAAEEFLVMTLKNTLTLINADEEAVLLAAETTSKADNSLGNTQTLISSEDNGQEAQYRITTNEEDETSQVDQQFVLQHHSPDALLYFLSRALAISPDVNHTNCGRRPYINQMKSLLLDLLDVRLGTTMNTCDLAMRILAGVYLGVVNVSNNTTANLGSKNNSIYNYHHQRHQPQQNSSSLLCDTAKISRINNLLQKEFELLVSLQSDVDGSWQADSIVQVGFSENSSSNANHDDSNDCNDCTDMYGFCSGVEMMGYLGGKELATLFAVKAISVFLSWKKGGFVCDDEIGFFDLDNAKHDDTDVTIHQMY